MRHTTGWLSSLGVLCALCLTGSAFAEAPASTTIVTNGVVALGVSGDGGLGETGTGLQFAPSGSDALALLCGCAGWSISTEAGPAATAVESFTFTGDAAVSRVLVSDDSGRQLRVTHDFHPTPDSPNLYEVLVSVENLAGTPVPASYSRQVGWASTTVPSVPALDPTLGLTEASLEGNGLHVGVDLGTIDPANGAQVFRLYLGAGAADVVTGGLAGKGASLISAATSTDATYVLGYAAGAAPLVATSGGAGGGGSVGASLSGLSPAGAGGSTGGVVSGSVTAGSGGSGGSGGSRGGGGGTGSGGQTGGTQGLGTSIGTVITTVTQLVTGGSTSGTTSTGVTTSAGVSGSSSGTGVGRLDDSNPGIVRSGTLVRSSQVTRERRAPEIDEIIPAGKTPELSSLALFGTGLAGAAGFASREWRSRGSGRRRSRSQSATAGR